MPDSPFAFDGSRPLTFASCLMRPRDPDIQTSHAYQLTRNTGGGRGSILTKSTSLNLRARTFKSRACAACRSCRASLYAGPLCSAGTDGIHDSTLSQSAIGTREVAGRPQSVSVTTCCSNRLRMTGFLNEESVNHSSQSQDEFSHTVVCRERRLKQNSSSAVTNVSSATFVLPNV